MKSFWGVWLFVILAACSPLPTVVVTPTAPATITSLPIPQIAPSETPSLHQETVLTPTPIKPTVKVLSPEIREVKLSELGLSNTTRLFLYYQPSYSLRIMSRQDIRPQKISITNPNAIISYGIEISPNQKWFIYKVFTEKRDGIAYYDLWISSVDGKDQRTAVSDVQGGTNARWVTDEQLELWHYPGGSTCPQRVLAVNPFTQEAQTSPEVPRSTSPQCFFELSTNPDHSKLIYLNESNGLWNIYDFKTGEGQNVFPWLSQSDAYTLWPKHIRWLSSGITFALPKQESINFAVDVSPYAAMGIDTKSNKISLPNNNKILDNWFSWVSLDESLVGFDMIESEQDPIPDSGETAPTKFVIFDLRHRIIYDYNLDRARTGGIQRVSDSFVYASVDNRFLAWTIYRPPDIRYAIETVVLDRETGQIARIKGFEFWGWGEVNQP